MGGVAFCLSTYSLNVCVWPCRHFSTELVKYSTHSAEGLAGDKGGGLDTRAFNHENRLQFSKRTLVTHTRRQINNPTLLF